MSRNTEYSKSMVGGPACGYAPLGCMLTSNSTMAPLRPGTTSGVYSTPNYRAIGYDALTYGGASCTSHPNIMNAYGAGAGSCNTTYTNRLCGGCNVPGGTQGYKCNQFMRECQPGGRLGEQGVYGNLAECNNRCKQLG